MKLKPCPFCGFKAQISTSPSGARFVECTKCGAATALMFPSKGDVDRLVAENWNDRIPAAMDNPLMRAAEEELARQGHPLLPGGGEEINLGFLDPTNAPPHARPGAAAQAPNLMRSPPHKTTDAVEILHRRYGNPTPEQRAQFEREDRADIEAYERGRQPLSPLRDHLIGLTEGRCVFCGEHSERIRSHQDLKCVINYAKYSRPDPMIYDADANTGTREHEIQPDWQCRDCGTWVPADMKSCTRCGAEALPHWRSKRTGREGAKA